MAAGFSVTITGDTQVAAMLRSVKGALNGRPMELALVSGALLIQNAAKSNAPWKTGTLRRSIHIGGHTDKAGDFAAGGSAPYSDIGGNSPRQVSIGTNVKYGRRIEYGFSDTDVLGRTYHQPPNPYLRPAMDSEEDAVRKEVAEALRDLLKAQLGGMMS